MSENSNSENDTRAAIPMQYVTISSIMPSDNKGHVRHQLTATILAALGGFMAGTALGWTSPVNPMLSEDNQTILSGETVIAEYERDIYSSLLAIGAICGSLPASKVVDIYGRKPTITLLGIPFIISWLLIYFASNTTYLYIARFLAGVSAGGFSATVPMFISEISQETIRGRLSSLFQMFIVLGILYVYCLGLTSYDIIALACLIVPLLFIPLFYFFAQESPYYFVIRDQLDGVKEALVHYRGNDYNIDGDLDNMKKEIALGQQNQLSFKYLFETKAVRRALLMSLGLMFLQQFCGINIVIFYSGEVFKTAGGKTSYMVSAIIIALIQVIATALSVSLIDKTGRRVLLLLSEFIMALCLTILGVYFHFKESGTDVSTYSLIPLITIGVYICMFSIGLGPIPWTMSSEIFSSNVRGIANGIASTANWIMAFLTIVGFNWLKSVLGTGWTFGMFAIICYLGTIFIYIYVIETKRKTFGQIQAELEGAL